MLSVYHILRNYSRVSSKFNNNEIFFKITRVLLIGHKSVFNEKVLLFSANRALFLDINFILCNNKYCTVFTKYVSDTDFWNANSRCILLSLSRMQSTEGMIFMKNNLTEKRRSFIINITYFSIILLLVFVFFKYALVWLMPFVIGFILASIANPIVTRITDRTKINRKLCAFWVMLLEYIIIFVLFWLVMAKIISSAESVFSNLPMYFDENIVPIWENLTETFSDISKRWPPELAQHFSAFTSGGFESLREFISNISEHFITSVADMTSEIPFIFLSVIFTILSSFFISMDYDKIKEFVRKILPQKATDIISDTKLQLGKTLWGYAKAYGIIMLITFTELLIGLAVLDIENFLGIAAIIAVFDILPVLGTGGILIPWSIYNFVTADYFLGFGLLILYVVTLVVRNFIEPKIIGIHLGLHPLVTIIALYVGYRLSGVLGMLALPVAITIILALNDKGKLKVWPLTKLYPEKYTNDAENTAVTTEDSE